MPPKAKTTEPNQNTLIVDFIGTDIVITDTHNGVDTTYTFPTNTLFNVDPENPVVVLKKMFARPNTEVLQIISNVKRVIFASQLFPCQKSNLLKSEYWLIAKSAYEAA